MAIVKMKKLRLAVMASERKALLKDLLLLGCVEVSEPSELESGSLNHCGSVPARSSARTGLTWRLYGRDTADEPLRPAKGGGFLSPLPEAKMASVLDEQPLQADRAIAEKVIGKEEDIKRAASETVRLEAEAAALAPWLELDVPIGFKGTERTVFATASLPAASDMAEVDTALGAAAPESQLFRVSRTRPSTMWRSSASRRSSRPRRRPCALWLRADEPSSRSGTAREETAKIELKNRGLAEQKQRLVAEIAQLASYRDELKLRADTLSTKIARGRGGGETHGTESTVLLTGWVPAEKEEELAVHLAVRLRLGDGGTDPRTSIRMSRSSSRTTSSQGR